MDRRLPGRRAAAGSVKIVHAGQISVGVYNLDGEFYAIEDRCSHDDGPLCEGEWDLEDGRRGLPAPRRQLRHPHRPRPDASGRARPVEIFPVRVDGRNGQGRPRAELVLDDRVRAVLARLEEEDRREREAGRRAASCARGRSRGRPASSSSRSSRRRPTARCSRSAARAATRRSGSPPASATSAAACSRSSTTRRRCEAWRRNIAEAGLERVGRARRGRRVRDAARDRRRLRRRLHRRREGRLRAAVRARARQGRAGRAVRRRQRALARRHARRVLAGAAGRPDARERHACRSTAGSSCRVVLSGPLACALPRKGGGPIVKSSSTGSGGTSG